MLRTVDRSVYWVSSGLDWFHFVIDLFIYAVPVSDISMKVNGDNKFEVNVPGEVKITARGS